ncbi:hypothetical protein QUF64_14565 [Anaerolineales bacterium HSG6]|nr:hypothetical protein [Anaerolineales bacterium HSG6]
MTKKKKNRYRKRKKLHCQDCGELLSPELTEETATMIKSLKMPNMLIFCDNCRHKLKNQLRRIWNGFTYLFE